jgi:hypothetical protein
VRTCSPASGRSQIIDDHLHYQFAEWNARHTAAVYSHVPIVLVPYAHEGRRWTYCNAKAVPWPKLIEGLAALDRAARMDGMIVTDIVKPRNVLLKNGTGIIVDFDLHRAWARDLFAPVLSWLGCAGCGSSQKEQRSQPRWCTHIMSHINFCDQVRLSPYLNLYGNEAMARSITASRASLRTSRSSRGQWRTRTGSKGQGETSSLAKRDFKSADAISAALSMARITRSIQDSPINHRAERGREVPLRT